MESRTVITPAAPGCFPSVQSESGSVRQNGSVLLGPCRDTGGQSGPLGDPGPRPLPLPPGVSSRSLVGGTHGRHLSGCVCVVWTTTHTLWRLVVCGGSSPTAVACLDCITYQLLQRARPRARPRARSQVVCYQSGLPALHRDAGAPGGVQASSTHLRVSLVFGGRSLKS